jgi:hypothetical protein
LIIRKYITFILLIIILIGAFAVRLYRFDNPIADWHSWRQADTSAVSRNFANHGFDVLHPRFDDLSNVPSGLDNPNGYRFVEFPLYNIQQATLYKIFGKFTIEQWGRLVSISSSLAGMVFLYLIVKRHSTEALGLLTAFYYGFIPYNIYYGRTILPDTTMVMAILGGIYFFDLWIEEKSKVKSQRSKVQFKTQNLFFFVSILFTASAFLLKPYALFFTLPMVVLAYQRFGLGMIRKWKLWIFAIISLAPLIWWRNWMTQFPEGIPANEWLMNGNGIRFRPAFFRWIIFERITKLISGYLGVALLAFGIWKLRVLKDWVFFLSFLVSSGLYIVVFATGNVQHDYYQILIMPSIVIFMAIGSSLLFQQLRLRFHQYTSILVVSAIVAVSFYFGWKQVKDFFNINNHSIIIAGEAVDRLTPKDAKVIANYTGDTSFLYQTKRKGWASFQNPLPEMIQKGADYLVLVNPTKQDMEFETTYRVLDLKKEYVIFDLKNKK